MSNECNLIPGKEYHFRDSIKAGWVPGIFGHFYYGSPYPFFCGPHCWKECREHNEIKDLLTSLEVVRVAPVEFSEWSKFNSGFFPAITKGVSEFAEELGLGMKPKGTSLADNPPDLVRYAKMPEPNSVKKPTFPSPLCSQDFDNFVGKMGPGKISPVHQEEITKGEMENSIGSASNFHSSNADGIKEPKLFNRDDMIDAFSYLTATPKPILTMEEKIRAACNKIADFLVMKDKSYGSAVSNPTCVFAHGLTVLDRINVRIDDKINRIMKGLVCKGDDDEKDLVGYLILKSIVVASIEAQKKS